jgi:uncharacterized SAM-binding protein YcdF (DUF218 family)
MLSAIATVLFVPPVNLVVIAFAGLALVDSRPVAGRRVVIAALAALLLLAVPVVAASLLAVLEFRISPVALPVPAAAQAIVILGGDAKQIGPTQDETDIGPLTLERVRGGAALARATGLPVLTSGGEITVAGPPLSVLMARSLATDFGVTARWVETGANTTWQNAEFSAKILKREGIGTVLLVTHAWHMRRALIAFRAAGIDALPAPLPLDPPPHLTPAGLVPRMSAWQRSYFALHEWIGCAWYAVRARFG